MCKGNFISPKMIDMKQIQFIADAKLMLYTSASQKLILWFNHKFIGRLLRMFSTQIWEKVDCKMKSQRLVNIWNMLAGLISSEIYNEKSLCSSARALHILTHSAFPWHTRRLGKTHTQQLRRLWADQAPTHSLAWSEGLVDVGWWSCISDFVCNGKKFSIS